MKTVTGDVTGRHSDGTQAGPPLAHDVCAMPAGAPHLDCTEAMLARRQAVDGGAGRGGVGGGQDSPADGAHRLADRPGGGEGGDLGPQMVRRCQGERTHMDGSSHRPWWGLAPSRTFPEDADLTTNKTKTHGSTVRNKPVFHRCLKPRNHFWAPPHGGGMVEEHRMEHCDVDEGSHCTVGGVT